MECQQKPLSDINSTFKPKRDTKIPKFHTLRKPAVATGQIPSAKRKPDFNAVSEANKSKKVRSSGYNSTISQTKTYPVKNVSTVKQVAVDVNKKVKVGRTAVVSKSHAPKSISAPGAGKTRPAWDLKGRLQETLNQTKLNSERHAAEREALISAHQEQIQNLENKIVKIEKIKEELEQSITNLELEVSKLKNKNELLESELEGSRNQCAALTSEKTTLTNELMSTKMQLEQVMNENTDLKSLNIRLEETISSQTERINQLESDRRLLHNTVQELKGNIRVFCRVRPLLPSEQSGNCGSTSHIEFPDASSDGRCIVLRKPGEAASNEGVISEFSFDRVFTPNSTQTQVFEEISQLVQSAMDGYHVCIFAYGQTGSGKTYTMLGPQNPDHDTEGMIPRAVNQVFASSDDMKKIGWQYHIEVSFLEIYNETIRDLLSTGLDGVTHKIKMISPNSNDVIVTNLTSVKVTEPSQVYGLLARASKKRAIAETNCNERSSRSHSIFQMKILGYNEVTEQKFEGLLNLIDLAGSENLKVSGSQGQRLVETQNINKSLSSLTTVMMALINKDAHIPYRNSKLTHLLQNSLGGESKVLMFVNVSPREESFGETIRSLRFAAMVNSCHIGTAKKRIK